MRIGTYRQRSRERWTIAAIAAVVFTLGAAAAQAATTAPLPPPSEWFGSAAAWGAVVVGLTAFVRANILKNLHDWVAVAVPFTIAIGGAAIANTGVLAFAGINLEGALGEALVFGVVAGAIAVGLYDGGSAIAAAGGKANARLQLAAAEAAAQTPAAARFAAGGTLVDGTRSQGINPQTLTTYLLQLIANRFGDRVPPMVWGILETLALEFAEAQLTEDVRAAIQHRFLDLLKAAGAPGRDT